jgi:20S proteasome subunit beta 6
MYADIIELQRNLKARIEIYRSTHKRDPDLEAVAQMLGIVLYMRRFFPYYAFNLLAGQKQDGTFTCYGYDAVGSWDEALYGAQGTGTQLVTPVLDNIINRKIKEGVDLTEQDAIGLVKETMNATANRDIYTGDKVEIMIMRKDGRFEVDEQPLRND